MLYRHFRLYDQRKPSLCDTHSSLVKNIYSDLGSVFHGALVERELTKASCHLGTSGSQPCKFDAVEVLDDVAISDVEEEAGQGPLPEEAPGA